MHEERKQILDRLIGALIGLARATEGNEYKLDENTASVMTKGLEALLLAEDYEDAALLELISCVTEEKRKLVPDCFTCQVSCGRNNDYDISGLERADEEVRELKSVILLGIQGLAVKANRMAVSGLRDEKLSGFLYKALYSIGMDEWENEELLPIIAEMGEMNLRWMKL